MSNSAQLEHILGLIESLEDAAKCAMVDDELFSILAPISLTAARMRECLITEEKIMRERLVAEEADKLMEGDK